MKRDGKNPQAEKSWSRVFKAVRDLYVENPMPIMTVIEDGRQATFQSFEDAEEWLKECAPDLYACSWEKGNAKAFREYNI